MNQPIALRPEMGPVILQHLRQFAPLPGKGILAGQAVDSAITDLWGKGGGVYNDLDVFRQCPTAANRPYLKANTTAMRSQLSLVRGADYDGMALFLQTTNTYGIASVSRKDMLNFVNCTMANGHYSDKLTAAKVLAGFDINSCRVGVDLETGLLHWDVHYEQFLASRQLKIIMMHTPWHTFLRLAKKSRELPGVYVNLEQAAMTCSGMARSRGLSQLLTNKGISLLFGQKNLELATRLRSDWAPYFKLEHVNFARLPGHGKWTANPNEVQHSNSLAEIELARMAPMGGVDPAIQARIDKLGIGSLFFCSRLVEESMRRKNNQVVVKFDTLAGYRLKQDATPEIGRVRAHLELMGTSYVAGQALPAVSDKVEAFFSKHTKFWGLMLGMTLDEQATAILRVTQVVQAFSREYLGRASQAPWGVLENQATLADLSSSERIRQLLVEDFNRNTMPFEVEPLVLPELGLEWPGYVVKEILSSGDLKIVGAEMGHCVGGYSSLVRKGKSRIVQLRGTDTKDSSLWSTAELKLGRSKTYGQLEYNCEQHKARFNKEPTANNEEVLMFVIRELNLRLNPANARLLETTNALA